MDVSVGVDYGWAGDWIIVDIGVGLCGGCGGEVVGGVGGTLVKRWVWVTDCPDGCQSVCVWVVHRGRWWVCWGVWVCQCVSGGLVGVRV